MADVRVVGKSCVDWVLNDVSRDSSGIVAIAQDALEVAFLPQTHTAASSMHSARSLFGHLYEALQI